MLRSRYVQTHSFAAHLPGSIFRLELFHATGLSIHHNKQMLVLENETARGNLCGCRCGGVGYESGGAGGKRRSQKFAA
jgi:hypothetical protein